MERGPLRDGAQGELHRRGHRHRRLCRALDADGLRVRDDALRRRPHRLPDRPARDHLPVRGDRDPALLRLRQRPDPPLAPAQHLLGADPPPDRAVGRVRRLLDARLLPLRAAVADRGGADRRRDELRRALARARPAGDAGRADDVRCSSSSTRGTSSCSRSCSSRAASRTRRRRSGSASSPAQRAPATRRRLPPPRCSSRCPYCSCTSSCNGISSAECWAGRSRSRRRGAREARVPRRRLDEGGRDDGLLHGERRRLRRLRGRARRPRPRAARADPHARDEDGARPRARHLGHRDDRPPRSARRRRRGALVLPAGRLPGARAGREDPARARRHRPGDPGRGRLLHGAPRDQRAQGRLRRDGGALPRRLDLQLHEPRQHRRRGDHAQLAGQGRLALRRARSTSATRSRTRPGSTSEKLHVTMVGLNHGCWGVEQDYDGSRPDAAARRGLGAPP